MDHAGFVRGLDPLGDLPADVERLVQREGATLQPRRQVFAGHELHRHEARVAHLINPEDLCDVGVVQRRERLRLALEPTQPLVVVG